MSGQFSKDPMLDMYLFETRQNIEQLEQSILLGEQTHAYSQEAINEIFRMMHTIKGSSAMMMFNNIATLAHSMEDLFFFIREHKPTELNYPNLSDLILEGLDFIKVELEKIKGGDTADGDAQKHIASIRAFLDVLKQGTPAAEIIQKPASTKKQQYYIMPGSSPNTVFNSFKATLFFEDGCEMENIRAYSVVHTLKDQTEELYHLPEELIENDDSIPEIRNNGFILYLTLNKSCEELRAMLEETLFLKELQLVQLENNEELKQFDKPRKLVLEENVIKVPKIMDKEPEPASGKENAEKEGHASSAPSLISVNVLKLDKLMDLVGEMVIAEAMVTQNPDLRGQQLDNFQKASRQLHKITTEIQDMVMSIRMVPLSTTFQKMHRIVRDMSKKLNKEVKLQLVGEETEVDKNIIEHISDPLMHLVRNAVDHGIEVPEERLTNQKAKNGTVVLEAKNVGSDVLILIRDDGKGLNKEKILARARENKLLVKPEADMTNREIFNLIFLPGFSTKDTITEFSGRGVGMDVVTKNIESVGGSVSVDSVEGAGTTITIKIPLTLAIIDGMIVRVGSSRYTIPTTAIKESFRPEAKDLILDPDGREMIMVRGQCYSILRLHQHFKVSNDITDFTKGILIMVEQDGKTLCLFADELLGQQQVVVKALPAYIKSTRKIQGLMGCTLLGDGNISLILDVFGLISNNG